MIWRHESSRSSKKIFLVSASWARRYRSGKTANRCSSCRAASATRGARRRGRATPSCSFGRRRRVSGAPVCCMSCRSATSDWSGRVAEFWPEFAQGGKEKITLAQLLSHQAGLAAFDESVDVMDHAAVVRALEKQKPLWPPGTAHGYHARTFGFLLDELVRRIASRMIGEYWREVFAEPLGLDIWIGLPAEENARVATIYPAKTGPAPPPDAFYRALTTPGTLQRRTFTSPRGLHAVSAMNTSGESGARVCLVWRNWQRDFARKILRHAGQRRRSSPVAVSSPAPRLRR